MIKIVANGVSMDLIPDLKIHLTIENPIFSTDRIPAAYSTNIEFPPTQKNLDVFQFQNKLFLKPGRRKVPASVYLNELDIMDGTLSFDTYEERMIKASFVGVELDDILERDLCLMDLPEWEFKDLSDPEKLRFGKLLDSAASGTEPFVCAPIRNENVSGQISIADLQNNRRISLGSIATNGQTGSSSSGSSSARPTPLGRRGGLNSYLNDYGTGFYSETSKDKISLNGFYCPAVRLSSMLSAMLSEKFRCENFDLSIMDDIVLITTSKPKAGFQHTSSGGLEPKDGDSGYLFSLSSPMPKAQAGDLLKEILKMFCVSIYAKGSEYLLLSNNNTIEDSQTEDWSDKISDSYSISIEKGKIYQYGYTREEDSEDPEEEPIKVPDILAMLNYGNFSEITYFEIESTKEVYFRDGYQEKDDKGNITLEDYRYKIIRQDGFSTNNTEGEDTFDSTVNLNLCKQHLGIRTLGNRASNFETCMWSTPLMNIPAFGSERPADLIIGLYQGFVPRLVQDGSKWKVSTHAYPAISSSPYDMVGNRVVGTSLSWEGEGGLFDRYHKTFAKWTETDKLTFRTEVKLTPIDLRNLILHKKKRIRGKKFLIRQLEVEITHAGLLPAEVDFVEVPEEI